ncbi:hypothetical protein [Kitasatospora sp. McL0602]|uniref:hypothetical protein n=1 Tax=Kitasatospora sp. McL0602 TaxID=3439530 RepID=UPI003F8ABC7E
MTQLALLPASPVPAGEAPTPTVTGPAPVVIGLDVAIGTTGVAGLGWTAHIHANQASLHERMEHQLTEVKSYIRNADFVVVEGPAFSKNNQGADALAAMRWMVRRALWKAGIPYAVVNPDSRTIYATGKARWRDQETKRKFTPVQVKGLVRAAVATQYGVECEGRWRYDEADAYVLMAMGLHHLGHPQADLPDTHTRALQGVNWPERTDQ